MDDLAPPLPQTEQSRQVVTAALAERARTAMVDIARTLANDGRAPIFALQLPHARTFAQTGDWEARAALASTLIGYAGELPPSRRFFAATAAMESATLFKGCTVDAPNPDSAEWASSFATAAASLSESLSMDRPRSFLFVLPYGVAEAAMEGAA